MKKNVNKNIEKIIGELGIKTTKYWIEMLNTLPSHEIGVIKASGKLLQGNNLQQLSAETAYLAKKAGLYIPLIVGGGIQYDKISSKKVNGIRITSRETAEKIYGFALENQKIVAKSLSEAGVDAEIISPENIVVQPHGYDTYSKMIDMDVGYVGEVITIKTKPIIKAINQGKIPVLTHLGFFGNSPYNINATTFAKELVKFIGAKKLILVGDTPVFDKNGELVKTIYSELEFKKLVQEGIIKGGMITNVEEAYDLLKYLGQNHCVQITSLKEGAKGLKSTGILEEILGDGSGTKIVLPPVITSYPIEALDKKMLESMINSAFKKQGKCLKKEYFKEIKKNDPTIYLDSSKKGGAISYPLNNEMGFEYLCKLFTLEGYEGLGIAMAIINTIYSQKNKLAWRASTENKCANEKYGKIVGHYNGFAVQKGKYMVYMLGISEAQKQKAAEIVAEIQPTLEALK